MTLAITPLHTSAPSSVRRWMIAAGAASTAALVFTADGDDGFVLCPFRRCTGGYCPGCGGTRATRNLLRGDIAAAWSHNPWVVVAAVQVIAGVIVLSAIQRITGDAIARLRPVALPLLFINTAALIGIWIVRLHDGSIPTGWL